MKSFFPYLIPIVAIVTPFLFTVWVIKNKRDSKEEKKYRAEQKSYSEMQEAELEKELSDLIRRIENLEILLKSRKGSKE
ncbi:MAG: hypothetical protein ACOXZ2_03645 [Sphaerochaetaceae bacterium]|nr:hypothetical protein [Sphaerochaetaceae bacterium]HHU88699.1 hypothetical protein [Spirochaetales bacterium]